MRIFITGHTGFKGKRLYDGIKSIGEDVYGYSLPEDILDFQNLNKRMKWFSPEIVYHLAAQPIVRKSYLNPRFTFDTNVNGTLNVLEACRNCPSVTAIVVITTDKVYKDTLLSYQYKEQDALGGNDPYSASKAMTEILCNSYYVSFLKPLGKHLATARSGNVIGGGDWQYGRLVPNMVRAILDNKDIIITHPNAVRPWQYVLDPIEGYIGLGQNLFMQEEKFAGAWNFGPDKSSQISVKDFVEMFIAEWGSGSYVIDKSGSVKETQTLMLDNSKSKRLLKWKPLFNVKQAIKKTVEDYKNEVYGMR